MTATYLDTLEKEVQAAARVLFKERYYEHVDCLYEMIRQVKHYQVIAEYSLCGVTGVDYEKSRKEFERTRNENDYFRHSNC